MPSRVSSPDMVIAVGLSIVWVLLALIVNPVGDFPLNDDWVYALTTKSLVENGTPYFVGAQSATALVQVLWGALFCLPTGFSFTALRLSTLTLALLGVLAFYLMLRRQGLTCQLSAVGALMLLACPIYLGLSYTFMTDVPFVALSIIGVHLILDGVRNDRGGKVWSGLGCALLATLTRQLGIAIPAAFVLAYPLKVGAGRKWACRALLPCAMAVCLLVASPLIWRATSESLSGNLSKAASCITAMRHLLQLRLGVLRYPFWRIVATVMYLGLFMAPLLVLAVPGLLEFMSIRTRKIGLGCVAAVTVCVTGGLFAAGRLMPMLGNIVVDFGIGPRTLPGAVPTAPRSLWLVVTAIAASGGAGMIIALVRSFRVTFLKAPAAGLRLEPWHFVFLSLIAVITFWPLGMSYAYYFDRYTLPLLPIAVLLVLPGLDLHHLPRQLGARVAAGALLVAYLGFGVGATHDYLALNRALWVAASYPVKELNAAPENVRGGYEHDGWFRHVRCLGGKGSHSRPGSSQRRYRLALSGEGGRAVVHRVSGGGWLPFAVPGIVVVDADTGAGHAVPVDTIVPLAKAGGE